jgi:hypothetical protein
LNINAWDDDNKARSLAASRPEFAVEVVLRAGLLNYAVNASFHEGGLDHQAL